MKNLLTMIPIDAEDKIKQAPRKKEVEIENKGRREGSEIEE